MDVRQNVVKTIEDNHMLETGDRILAGVSGGADSVCLLLILHSICSEKNIYLRVLHVHHGLRGESADRDEAFVRTLCRERDIPFHAVHVDMKKTAQERGLSEEEAGRVLRYEAFSNLMREEKLNKLFLAHQADDLAETMLHNMARGSGLRGLSSLRAVRDHIFRPLLFVPRRDIEAFLASEGTDFCHDETNDSDDYTRNAIRHHVLPSLAEINPGFLSHMAALSADILEAEHFLEREGEKRKNQMTEIREADIFIKEELFEEGDSYPVTELLISLMGEAAGCRQDIGRVHAEALKALIGKEEGKKISLPHGLEACRIGDGILLGKRKGQPSESTAEAWTDKEIPLPLPGEIPFRGGSLITEIPAEKPAQIPKKTWSKWFDCDRMSDVIVLRTRRPGDYLIIDPTGHRKSLSDYLTDIKYPKEERDKLPVIACASEILWIPGLRSGEGRRVTDATQKILGIRIVGV